MNCVVLAGVLYCVVVAGVVYCIFVAGVVYCVVVAGIDGYDSDENDVNGVACVVYVVVAGFGAGPVIGMPVITGRLTGDLAAAGTGTGPNTGAGAFLCLALVGSTHNREKPPRAKL